MQTAKIEEYTSENTVQLDVGQTKELLLMIPEMREFLKGTNA